MRQGLRRHAATVVVVSCAGGLGWPRCVVEHAPDVYRHTGNRGTMGYRPTVRPGQFPRRTSKGRPDHGECPALRHPGEESLGQPWPPHIGQRSGSVLRLAP